MTIVLGFLSSETTDESLESYKAGKHPPASALYQSTWRKLDAELKVLLDEELSGASQDPATSRERISRLVTYCKLVFTKDAHVQKLACASKVHAQLLRCAWFDAYSAFAALSNLVTKNGKVARTVLADIAEAAELPIVSGSSAPVSLFVFLFNSLRAENFGNVDNEVAPLLHWCITSVMRTMTSDEDSDAQVKSHLMTKIMQGLLETQDLYHVVNRIRQKLWHNGSGSIEAWHDYWRFVLQSMLSYCTPIAEFSNHTVGVIENVHDCLHNFTKRLHQLPVPTRSDLHLDAHQEFRLCMSSIATLLNTVVELLTNSECSFTGDCVSNCRSSTVLPDVIAILRYTTTHVPRPAGGRIGSSLSSWPVMSRMNRNCVSIIANLSFEDRGTQDQVRELGGLPLILGQCKIDEMNPHVQEYAAFCIRCLLDGNPENQKMVESLRPVSSVPT